MPYRAELDYLMKVLEKMRLQALRIRADGMPGQMLDLGLRKVLGLEEDYARMFQPPIRWAKQNTIYRVTDPFLCNYILLLLPDAPKADALLVGPYLTFEKTREQLLEEAERYGLSASRFRRLESCYADIPVLRDEGPLFSMLNVLGETLWGRGAAFSIIAVNRAEPESSAALSPGEGDDPEEIMLNMRSMETRYAYENQLMEAVSQGLTHRAEMMIRGFSRLTLEERTPDPVRNMKNYAIICNTLLRKAAEKGGVHPVYLDSTSSGLARRIEGIADFNSGVDLMRDMVRAYCRLVRQHTSRHYSPLVQKAVTYIDSDLAGDLSLRALAALENVSAGYLSTLFHRETGKTVTEYVTEARMDRAAQLLRSTHLQVQTVAQYCGISDVNYFSKLFKRRLGVTPRQFREAHRTHPPDPA